MKKLLMLFGLLLILGCANQSKEDLSAIPENELLQLANNAFEEKNYSRAALLFKTIVDEHPFSETAAKAQIMEAYSYYLGMKFIDAEIAVEEFLILFPGNPETEWAYYLRALIYYDQILIVKLDQDFSSKAKEAINEYKNRYPDGKYINDLTLKLDLVNEHLAGKEMLIGRYYQSKVDYVAAINRYKDVYYQYSTTSQIEEALYRLVECYMSIGLHAEAKKYAAVLGYNYPQGKWYKYSYDLLNKNVN